MEDYAMKNRLLPFLVIMLAGCGSSPRAEIPGVQGISIDTAIQQAARNIENNIDAGRKVVVLNFSSSSDDFSDYVLGELSTELVNGRKLQVVDRRNLDAIRAEMDFQMSGEVSDESAQAIGRKLGAEYIISGSLANAGGIYRFRINTINVESAGIAAASAADIANDSKVKALLAGGRRSAGPQTAQRGGGGGNKKAAAPPAPAAPPPVPVTYNVGDTGPAGGIVFFDMGFYMDGWRYLEAAPQDFPTSVKWTNAGIGTFSTETGVGTGKQNTVFLVSFLRDQGETMRAAQVVSVPEYGGYGDWFLPSRDELNLLYETLWKQRIGNFSNKAYWSSSGGIRHGTDWNLVAWQVNFSDGAQNRVGCSADGLVRAVRRF
jgi:TolB-like protein